MICLKCDNFADFLIWCRLALALLCVPVRYLFTVSRQLLKQGGYIASLGRTRASSLAAVNYLRAKHWLDRHTAAVRLEFALLNADANLWCSVRVLWQFPSGGGAKSDVNVNSMRFYRSTSSGFYIFVLIFELLYLVYTLYMIVHEIRQIRRRKWRYLRSISGCIDMSACLLSVVVIVLYLTFLIEAGGIMSKYKRQEDIVAYFSYLIELDNSLAYVFGMLILIGTLKFLHILRFNPLIWRFILIFQYAKPSIISALSMIIVGFVAFGSFMHVVGGRSIEHYSSMVKSLATLYEGLLGILCMDDLDQIHQFFGPFLYLVFLFVLTIAVYNLNLIVLFDSLKHVSRRPMPHEETEILWMLVYKFVQYLGIKVHTH